MKMKSMRMKKAMKVSKIAKGKMARSVVWRGYKEKTLSGLKKTDLTKSSTGKIVSKKQSTNGKKHWQRRIGKWVSAVQKARKTLNLSGFVPVGGKTRQGATLLAKARSFYKK